MKCKLIKGGILSVYLMETNFWSGSNNDGVSEMETPGMNVLAVIDGNNDGGKPKEINSMSDIQTGAWENKKDETDTSTGTGTETEEQKATREKLEKEVAEKLKGNANSGIETKPTDGWDSKDETNPDGSAKKDEGNSEVNDEIAESVMSVAATLHEDLGFDFTDKEQEEFAKTYGLGTDAISKFVKDITSNSIESVLTEYPQVNELHKFLKNGGKYEDFYTARQEIKEYSSFDTKNEEHQKALVTDYLKKTTKFNDERIKSLVDYDKEKGLLEKSAEDAKDYLIKDGEEREKAIKTKAEKDKIDTDEKATKLKDDMVEFISQSDNIGGIPISKENKQKLLTYMFEATEKVGNSKVSAFVKSLSDDKNPAIADIQMAYLRMLNFDVKTLASLVKTDVTKEVKKVWKGFASNNRRDKSTGSANAGTGKDSVNDNNENIMSYLQ